MIEYSGTILNTNFNEQKKIKARTAALENTICDLQNSLRDERKKNDELQETITELRARINRDRNRIADLNCKVRGIN